MRAGSAVDVGRTSVDAEAIEAMATVAAVVAALEVAVGVASAAREMSRRGRRVPFAGINAICIGETDLVWARTTRQVAVRAAVGLTMYNNNNDDNNNQSSSSICMAATNSNRLGVPNVHFMRPL